MKTRTLCIHAGEEKEGKIGSINVPIHQSSTYTLGTIDRAIRILSGEEEGFVYTRGENPTTTVLEKKLALLEKGEKALCFSSGMGAISASILSLVKKGDEIVVSHNIYGTSHRFLIYLENNLDIKINWIWHQTPEDFLKATTLNTRLYYLESPTNPTLEVADTPDIVKIAKENRVLTIFDNTFATPINQNPLEWGVDLVTHSLTKYVGGHSDVVAGAVIGSKEKIEKIHQETYKLFGSVLSPFDSYLLIRGIKTLPLRMEYHNRGAEKLANYLYRHPIVKKVNYPGLPSHPTYNIARKLMKGFSGMISIEVENQEIAKKVMESLEIAALGVSLGGLETLVQHPYTMSHGTMEEDIKAKTGITPGLIRISVGLEDPEDLIEDFAQALNQS